MQELTNNEQWLREVIRTEIREALSLSAKEEDPSEVFLNAKEAAAFIGDAMPTFYKRTSQGEFTLHGSGKKIFIRKSDLIEWLSKTKGYSKEQLETRAIDNMRKRRKP
jgi:predicted DNA-binding transcriptional regulator AlpA